MKHYLLYYLILLLSTDWFVDAWDLLGLDTEPDSRRTLRDRCRDIARQLYGSITSWDDVDTREPRIIVTRKSFLQALDEAGIDSISRSQITAFLGGVFEADLVEPKVFMLTLLTMTIVTGQDPTSDPRRALDVGAIPANVREVVRKTWSETEPRGLDLVTLERHSQSDWDVFVRNLFSQRPDALVSFAWATLIMPLRFREFWSLIEQRLSERERRQLVDWYKDAATITLQRGFDVPDWVR